MDGRNPYHQAARRRDHHHHRERPRYGYDEYDDWKRYRHGEGPAYYDDDHYEHDLKRKDNRKFYDHREHSPGASPRRNVHLEYTDDKGRHIAYESDVEDQIGRAPSPYYGNPRKNPNKSKYPHEYKNYEKLFSDSETCGGTTRLSEYPCTQRGDREFDFHRKVNKDNKPGKYRGITDKDKNGKGLIYHDEDIFSRAKLGRQRY